MIRVILPPHLRMHADIDGEVRLAVDGQATQRSVLDALETRYPVLRGAIRGAWTALSSVGGQTRAASLLRLASHHV